MKRLLQVEGPVDRAGRLNDVLHVLALLKPEIRLELHHVGAGMNLRVGLIKDVVFGSSEEVIEAGAVLKADHQLIIQLDIMVVGLL